MDIRWAEGIDRKGISHVLQVSFQVEASTEQQDEIPCHVALEAPCTTLEKADQVPEKHPKQPTKEDDHASDEAVE